MSDEYQHPLSSLPDDWTSPEAIADLARFDPSVAKAHGLDKVLRSDLVTEERRNAAIRRRGLLRELDAQYPKSPMYQPERTTMGETPMFNKILLAYLNVLRDTADLLEDMTDKQCATFGEEESGVTMDLAVEIERAQKVLERMRPQPEKEKL